MIPTGWHSGHGKTMGTLRRSTLAGVPGREEQAGLLLFSRCVLLASFATPRAVCNLPASSVLEVLQARILAWVAISFSRRSSRIRDGTRISCIGKQILYHWATWETQQVADRRFLGQWKYSAWYSKWCRYVMIDLSNKPRESTRWRVSPNVNYGLWVIMMCQWGFINSNKYTKVVGVSIVREAVHMWGRGAWAKWGISVPFSQFCCHFKIALIS